MIRKLYIKTLCGLLLRGAQKSIGLKYKKVKTSRNGLASIGDIIKNPIKYSIFFAEDYENIENIDENISTTHLVIGNGEYKILNYSSNPREQSCLTIKCTSFIEISLQCAKRQLSAAIFIAMSKDENYKPIQGILNYEESCIWGEFFHKHEESLDAKLKSFTSSTSAKFLNWQIDTFIT